MPIFSSGKESDTLISSDKNTIIGAFHVMSCKGLFLIPPSRAYSLVFIIAGDTQVEMLSTVIRLMLL